MVTALEVDQLPKLALYYSITAQLEVIEQLQDFVAVVVVAKLLFNFDFMPLNYHLHWPH